MESIIHYKRKQKILGAGAFAKVYYFTDPITNLKVAEKFLNNDITEKEYKRFKQEFEKMNLINYPHILKAYTFDEELRSYTMEYCDYSLKKYIESNNNKDFMTFEFRKKLALQFLDGIKYLHAHEMLHRDISLNNILIKIYDDNIIVVKLSDFGLIKDINLELTTTDSEIRGTFIDDTLENFKDYNVKNEIYSIGRVLWFIFTGKTNLSLTDNNIGKIINKCINRNVDNRYNNVDEIINDLIDLKEEQQSNKDSNVEISTLISHIPFKSKSYVLDNIDENAFVILKAMVEDNAQNQLIYTKDLIGERYQTSDGSFILNLSKYSPRDKMKWKTSFESLVYNEYIQTLDYKNEIFEVTKKGYDFYDTYIDTFNQKNK